MPNTLVAPEDATHNSLDTQLTKLQLRFQFGSSLSFKRIYCVRIYTSIRKWAPFINYRKHSTKWTKVRNEQRHSLPAFFWTRMVFSQSI